MSFLAAIAAAAAAFGHAGVVDRTISCPTTSQGARPVVWFQANTTSRSEPVATLRAVPLRHSGIVDNDPAQLSVDTKDGLSVDTASCAASRVRPALTASGLAASTTITSTFIGKLEVSCRIADVNRPDRVILRISVSGVQRAQLIATNARTRKPIAYFVWTPSRVKSWLAPACEVYH